MQKVEGTQINQNRIIVQYLQIGFAAVHVSDLKLVEAGLAKETKAILSVPLIPISLLLPVVVSKWTAGRRPMGLYAKAFAAGLVVSGVIGVMVWVTGAVKDTSGGFPGWYLPLLLLVECAFKVNHKDERISTNKRQALIFFISTDLQSNDFRIDHGI